MFVRLKVVCLGKVCSFISVLPMSLTSIILHLAEIIQIPSMKKNFISYFLANIRIVGLIIIFMHQRLSQNFYITTFSLLFQVYTNILFSNIGYSYRLNA